MKRRMVQILSGVSLVWVLSMSAAFSQSSEAFVSTIPFSFHVQQLTMPAGEYVVQLSSSPTSHVLIRSIRGGNAAFLLTTPMKIGGKDGHSRLVFTQYGSDYFLSKIPSPIDSVSQELIEGKLEKQVAANNPVIPPTEIALRRHR